MKMHLLLMIVMSCCILLACGKPAKESANTQMTNFRDLKQRLKKRETDRCDLEPSYYCKGDIRCVLYNRINCMDEERWHYNPNTDDCETFTYDGCGRPGNNFYTKSDCVIQCVKVPKTTPGPDCSSCRHCTLRSTSGTIHSPWYPRNYPNKAGCEWDIVAPEDHTIVLRLESYDIEYGDKCQYDRLLVFDGSVSKGVYCGQGSNVTIKSDGNELEIFFISDMVLTKPGFTMTYTIEGPKE